MADPIDAPDAADRLVRELMGTLAKPAPEAPPAAAPETSPAPAGLSAESLADELIGPPAPPGPVPKHRAGPRNSLWGATADKVATPVLRGVAGVLSFPHDALRLAEMGVEAYNRAMTPFVRSMGVSPAFPDPADTMLGRGLRAAQRVVPANEPMRDLLFGATGVRETNAESAPGRILQDTVEMGVGSSIIPTQRIGALGRMRDNALLGGLSGAASGTAGELTEGTSAEPYARAAAGLGVPLVAMGLMKMAPSVAELLWKQVKGMPRDKLREAEELLRASHAEGNPLLLTEALQRVAGQPNTVLQAAQREVGTSTSGAGVMDGFMHNRAGANRQSFERGLAPLEGRTAETASALPPSDPALMSSLPHRVADAAEGAIGDARAARNAAVRPDFERASQELTGAGANALGRVRYAVGEARQRLQKLADETKDPALLQLLKNHDLDTILDKFGRQLEAATPRGAANGSTLLPLFENLNSTRATFSESLRRPVAPIDTALPSELARRADGILGDLYERIAGINDDIAGGAGKGGFGQGMRRFHEETQGRVAPLVDGAVGKVAKTESQATQRTTLFGDSPRAGAIPQTPESVRASVEALAGQPGGAAATRDLVANLLREEFEKAAARKASRVENPHSGAEWAANVAGNAEQRAALEAAVRAMPHGDEAWKGLAKLLDTFEAHQFTLPANAVADAKGAVGRSLRTNSGMMQPPGGTLVTQAINKVLSVLDESRRGDNTMRLAQLLTSPDGMTRLRALARSNGLRPKENAALLGIRNMVRGANMSGNAEHPEGGAPAPARPLRTERRTDRDPASLAQRGVRAPEAPPSLDGAPGDGVRVGEDGTIHMDVVGEPVRRADGGSVPADPLTEAMADLRAAGGALADTNTLEILKGAVAAGLALDPRKAAALRVAKGVGLLLANPGLRENAGKAADRVGEAIGHAADAVHPEAGRAVRAAGRAGGEAVGAVGAAGRGAVDGVSAGLDAAARGLGLRARDAAPLDLAGAWRAGQERVRETDDDLSAALIDPALRHVRDNADDLPGLAARAGGAALDAAARIPDLARALAETIRLRNTVPEFHWRLDPGDVRIWRGQRPEGVPDEDWDAVRDDIGRKIRFKRQGFPGYASGGSVLDTGDAVEDLRMRLPDLPTRGDGSIAGLPGADIRPAGRGERIRDELARVDPSATVVATGMSDGGNPQVGGLGGVLVGPRMARMMPDALEALREAQAREARGAAYADLWRDVGWTRSVDGRWVAEMPDDHAGFMSLFPHGGARADAEGGQGFSAPLGRIYGHPELYRASPNLADLPVTFLRYGSPEAKRLLPGGMRAGYHSPDTAAEVPTDAPWDEAITVTYPARPGAWRDPRVGGKALQGLVHEVQHAVRTRDDPSLPDQSMPYALRAEEIESRVAERRAFLTQEQREAMPPFAWDAIQTDSLLAPFPKHWLRDFLTRQAGGRDVFRSDGGEV